ncbi:MAG: hypothetical protein R3C46_15750 [Hyphomonadaceae bacterium]
MPESMEQRAGGKVPVMECFKAAWQFLDRNWRLLLLAAAITAALSQVGVVLTLLASPPVDQTQTMLSVTLWDLVAGAPALIAGLMFAAAVLRKAVRDEFLPPTGLAFGADELRLLGVTAALVCVFLPIAALLFVVVSFAVLSRLAATPEQLDALLADPDALADALQNTLGQGGVTAMLMFVAIGLVAIAYLSVRLTMVNAATIGERKMVIFQTWRWSAGNVLRMFAATILTALPVVFFEAILDAMRAGVLEGMTLEGAGGGATLVIINGATAFLLSIASIPTIALGAILYKGLRPQDFVAR